MNSKTVLRCVLILVLAISIQTGCLACGSCNSLNTVGSGSYGRNGVLAGSSGGIGVPIRNAGNIGIGNAISAGAVNSLGYGNSGGYNGFSNALTSSIGSLDYGIPVGLVNGAVGSLGAVGSPGSAGSNGYGASISSSSLGSVNYGVPVSSGGYLIGDSSRDFRGYNRYRNMNNMNSRLSQVMLGNNGGNILNQDEFDSSLGSENLSGDFGRKYRSRGCSGCSGCSSGCNKCG